MFEAFAKYMYMYGIWMLHKQSIIKINNVLWFSEECLLSVNCLKIH